VRGYVWNVSANDELDITSNEMLENLAEEFHREGIEFMLAEIHQPFKQMAARSGLLEKIGTDQIFETLDEAVQHFQTVRVK
jgi:sulfate permease, SulP family